MTKKTKRVNVSSKNPFWRVTIWMVPGVIIGLFVPWYFYLQFIVNNLFVEYNWSIPSVIYAQELNLYNGKSLKADEVLFHLSVLGYKNKSKANKIGEYSYKNRRFEIKTKGFKYLDKNDKPSYVSFALSKDKVINLNRSIARLEPLLIGQFYNKTLENRQPIPLNQIPNTMVKGLQAIEDRSFKHHSGVDVFGIIRAMVRNLFAGKIVQGGSTITQQLIKNRFHYDSKSWLRKANEAVSALMLEKKFNKGQILESYFNEIYWGQKGSYAIHGISQAAQLYYSKIPGQLTIAEQALLIGIVKGPSWFHPVKQKTRALTRRNSVLNTWYETSVINKKQWQKAKSTNVDVKINTSFANRQYQDFIDVVNQQLSQSFSSGQLNRQGLKIFTTINPYIQRQLADTLQNETDKLGRNLQSAAVVSNAQTGNILAIKGSKTDTAFFNRAKLSKRQIGSLIKPFVYLAAYESLPDFDLSTLINDSPLKIKTKTGEYWQPKNYDNKSMGLIDARSALIKSRNQATVDLGIKIGVQSFVSFLKKVGLNINRSKHPSVFLGATELTPLEVTNLFLLFSSSNQQSQLLAVKYITDNDNNLLGKIKKSHNLQVQSSSVSQINSALHQVTTQGTAAKLSTYYHFKDLYGKTGTTNQGKNSWYVGYNKDLLATFWVGKDNNTPTKLSGSSGALILWAHWYRGIK